MEVDVGGDGQSEGGCSKARRRAATAGTAEWRAGEGAAAAAGARADEAGEGDGSERSAVPIPGLSTVCSRLKEAVAAARANYVDAIAIELDRFTVIWTVRPH